MLSCLSRMAASPLPNFLRSAQSTALHGMEMLLQGGVEACAQLPWAPRLQTRLSSLGCLLQAAVRDAA